MNCLVLGCGRMGSALVKSVFKKDVFSKDNFYIVEPNLDRHAEFIKLKLNIFKTIDQIAVHSIRFDLVVLAVKPQIIREVIEHTKKLINNNFLVISIAAGIKIDFFESILGSDVKIIRAMPNTPAEIGKGITALIKSSKVSSEQKTIAENIFNGMGKTLWIENEELMDVITAISGSGPAYIFYIVEIMVSVAVNEGLSEDLANLLVSEMVVGSGSLMVQSNKLPNILRDEVTSPGGTTEAAIKTFESNKNFRLVFEEALHNAIKKSKELSNKN